MFKKLLDYVRLEVKLTTQHSLAKELFSFLGLLAELFPDKCPGEAEALKKLLLSTLTKIIKIKKTTLGPADFNVAR